MVTRPVERRALGLVMREAEQRGIITPPSELRQLVAGFPYPPKVIDAYLELLVGSDGRTIGGTLDLDQLESRSSARLAKAGLIEKVSSGDWDLTEKGVLFSLLLDEYANPRHHWRTPLVPPSIAARGSVD